MNATFVDHEYEIDPRREIFLKSGSLLSEGMEVLVGDMKQRVNVSKLINPDRWIPIILAWHTPGHDYTHESIVERTLRRKDMLDENFDRDMVREALRMNRWCMVTKLGRDSYRTMPDINFFTGIYHDGTQFVHCLPVETPWLVRKPVGRPYK